MAFPLIIIAATAVIIQAAQPSAGPPQNRDAVQRPGHAFLSPMGEPVFGRTPNEDGLVVWFQQVDRNHDGQITVDEMVADADRFFAILDTDHDGEIDPDEIAQYETVIAPEVRTRWIASGPSPFDESNPQSSDEARTGGGGLGGGPGGPGGEGRGGNRGGHRSSGRNADYGGFGGDDESAAGRFGLLEIPEPVSSADSDFDRAVSKEEFRSAAIARFKLLDIDHTGRLTLPELERIRQAAEADARHPAKDRSDEEESPQE